MRPPSKWQQEAAELIHELFCTYNHTDGCGWWYEVDRGENKKWQQHAHARYLAAAVEIQSHFSSNQSSFMYALKWLRQLRNEGKL